MPRAKRKSAVASAKSEVEAEGAASSHHQHHQQDGPSSSTLDASASNLAGYYVPAVAPSDVSTSGDEDDEAWITNDGGDADTTSNVQPPAPAQSDDDDDDEGPSGAASSGAKNKKEATCRWNDCGQVFADMIKFIDHLHNSELSCALLPHTTDQIIKADPAPRYPCSSLKPLTLQPTSATLATSTLANGQDVAAEESLKPAASPSSRTCDPIPARSPLPAQGQTATRALREATLSPSICVCSTTSCRHRLGVAGSQRPPWRRGLRLKREAKREEEAQALAPGAARGGRRWLQPSTTTMQRRSTRSC